MEEKKKSLAMRGLIGFGNVLRKGVANYQYRQTPEYKKKVVEDLKLQNKILDQQVGLAEKNARMRKLQGNNQQKRGDFFSDALGF